MKHLALAAAILAAPLPARAGSLGPCTDFFVFGDSLSDPGNTLSQLLEPDPGLAAIYPQGQFTDGATWATQLGAGLASGANFAFGGAPLNEEFGRAIGADACCRDAAVAVETAKTFIARKHNQAVVA